MRTLQEGSVLLIDSFGLTPLILEDPHLFLRYCVSIWFIRSESLDDLRSRSRFCFRIRC